MITLTYDDPHKTPIYVNHNSITMIRKDVLVLDVPKSEEFPEGKQIKTKTLVYFGSFAISVKETAEEVKQIIEFFVMIETLITNTQHFAKERIFIVRIKKIARNNNVQREPYVEVSYNDANKKRHVIQSFCLKDTDVGIVAGELIDRLIPQLGDK